jgi:hypothetical protein
MGTYSSLVQIFNQNGLHLANASIAFADSTALNAGDVSALANGAEGSFWISQSNSRAYLGQSGGATLVLSVVSV